MIIDHSLTGSKRGRVLGRTCIAFGVILLKEFNVFVWNSDTLLTFEFCDLLISICVLICASKPARLRPPPVLVLGPPALSGRASTSSRGRWEARASNSW